MATIQAQLSPETHPLPVLFNRAQWQQVSKASWSRRGRILEDLDGKLELYDVARNKYDDFRLQQDHLVRYMLQHPGDNTALTAAKENLHAIGTSLTESLTAFGNVDRAFNLWKTDKSALKRLGGFQALFPKIQEARPRIVQIRQNQLPTLLMDREQLDALYRRAAETPAYRHSPTPTVAPSYSPGTPPAYGSPRSSQQTEVGDSSRHERRTSPTQASVPTQAPVRSPGIARHGR
jgi:hypothetical protein